MGKLALDPVPVEAAPVEFGTQQVAEAVAGLAAFVAGSGERLVYRVLAHRPGGAAAGEHQGMAAGDLLQLAQDGHGLAG